MYQLESTSWKKSETICGVDEAGRGSFAGPVVIAAAILKPGTYHKSLIDSKKLSQKQLPEIYKWLIENCSYSIAISSSRTIDIDNIYQTTLDAMKSALLHLFATKTTAAQLPTLILVDAMPIKLEETPYKSIELQSFTQGESKSASVAAASIIAKVTRDQIMQRMAKTFPAYQLDTHKGYGTALHHEMLALHHPSITHRKAYLRNFLKRQNNKLHLEQPELKKRVTI